MLGPVFGVGAGPDVTASCGQRRCWWWWWQNWLAVGAGRVQLWGLWLALLQQPAAQESSTETTHSSTMQGLWWSGPEEGDGQPCQEAQQSKHTYVQWLCLHYSLCIRIEDTSRKIPCSWTEAFPMYKMWHEIWYCREVRNSWIQSPPNQVSMPVLWQNICSQTWQKSSH